MGMFDTVEYKEGKYQTKYFRCASDQYRIVNNRLQILYFDWDDNNGVRTNKHWADTNFHGEFDAINTDDHTLTNFKFSRGKLIAYTILTPITITDP